MYGPWVRPYNFELPIILELDIAETLCSNSSIVADDFIRILKNIIVDLWENKSIENAGFFFSRKTDNSSLKSSKLIIVDTCLCDDYLIDIMQYVSIQLDAIAAGLVAETHVLFENGEMIIDSKAQKSLILSIDHCYANPHKQCWIAPIEHEVIKSFVYYGELALSLLPDHLSTVFNA